MKIDGRQEQEETSALLKSGAMRPRSSSYGVTIPCSISMVLRRSGHSHRTGDSDLGQVRSRSPQIIIAVVDPAHFTHADHAHCSAIYLETAARSSDSGHHSVGSMEDFSCPSECEEVEGKDSQDTVKLRCVYVYDDS